MLFGLLMLPALAMLAPLAFGASWREPIRPTGEAAAVLLLLALAISPLKALFGANASTRWLSRQRRAIGLAAFGYALIHMIVFAMSIGDIGDIVAGMAWASMWTGWAAFAALLVMAAISNDHAVRALGPIWKRMQRLAYPTAILTLAHWLLLTRDWSMALASFTLLGLLQMARLAASLRRKETE